MRHNRNYRRDLHPAPGHSRQGREHCHYRFHDQNHNPALDRSRGPGMHGNHLPAHQGRRGFWDRKGRALDRTWGVGHRENGVRDNHRGPGAERDAGNRARGVVEAGQTVHEAGWGTRAWDIQDGQPVGGLGGQRGLVGRWQEARGGLKGAYDAYGDGGYGDYGCWGRAGGFRGVSG